MTPEQFVALTKAIHDIDVSLTLIFIALMGIWLTQILKLAGKPR